MHCAHAACAVARAQQSRLQPDRAFGKCVLENKISSLGSFGKKSNIPTPDGLSRTVVVNSCTVAGVYCVIVRTFRSFAWCWSCVARKLAGSVRAEAQSQVAHSATKRSPVSAPTFSYAARVITVYVLLKSAALVQGMICFALAFVPFLLMCCASPPPVRTPQALDIVLFPARLGGLCVVHARVLCSPASQLLCDQCANEDVQCMRCSPCVICKVPASKCNRVVSCHSSIDLRSGSHWFAQPSARDTSTQC